MNPKTRQNTTPTKRRQKQLAVQEDLIGPAALYRSSQFLLPVGNDYFNGDSQAVTTTAAPPGEEIGRWRETLARSKALVVATIGRWG